MWSRMNSLLRRALPFLLGPVLVMQATAPVEATTSYWGSVSCGPNLSVSICLEPRDNPWHGGDFLSVCYQGFTSALISDSGITLQRFTDTTNVYGLRVYSASAADATAYYANYQASGYWGATYCPSSSTRSGSDPYRTCSMQNVRFNSYYASFFGVSYNRQYVTCQEYGHLMGLHHRNANTCMWPVNSNTLDSFDIININDYY